MSAPHPPAASPVAAGEEAADRVLVLTALGGQAQRSATATALVLAGTGLAVTVVAPATGSARVESSLTAGSTTVRVVRIPFSTVLRASSRARRSSRRSRLGFVPDPRRRRALELRASLREREAALVGGQPALARRLAARLRLATVRAQGYAGRRLGDVERTVWSTIDRVVASTSVGVGWRRVLPELDDVELSAGHVVDRLDWDVIHAQGVAAAGVAARAVQRRRDAGRPARWVYDVQDAMAADPPDSTRRRAARHRVEREYLGSASLVVTEDGTPPRSARRLRQGSPRVVARADVVDAYRELLGRGGSAGSARPRTGATATSLAETAAETTVGRVVERPVSIERVPSVLGIGPANMAGQGWEWARAAERVVPGLRAEVVAVDRDSAMVFEADRTVPAESYAKDPVWAAELETHVLDTWTHALLEAGRPLFGLGRGRDFVGDAAFLRAAGLQVGLVMHGSEIRDPRRNAERSPWSPFLDPAETLTHRLQQKRDALYPVVAEFDGPVFVSTPDLLDEVPGAVLLPVVVDVAAWATDHPLLERDRPVVVHLPSRAALKGSEHVERAMEVLLREQLVDYRRLDAVPHDEVRALVRDADIVLDQFSIGTYGVLAVEAMAAGRLVVSHVGERARRALGVDLPIVEATPDSLVDVLRGALAERDEARAVAARGPGFAAEHHDGRRSGATLRDVLGLRGS